MTLTAKENITFTFGDPETSVTCANAGDELELLEDLGNVLNVKNKQGNYFYVTKEQVDGL